MNCPTCGQHVQPKPEILDLLVILDRSASMRVGREEHEAGLRSFVDEQRKMCSALEDVRLTFVQFDSVERCHVVYDRAPLSSVQNDKLSLVPRGDTPLLDAIGLATGLLLGKAPSRVICLVITDGEENASYQWTLPQTKALITGLESGVWKFLFLGANVDAFQEAKSLGINLAMAANYRPDHAKSAYAGVSHNILRARTMRAAGASAAAAYSSSTLSFDEEQRSAAMGQTPADKVATGGTV